MREIRIDVTCDQCGSPVDEQNVDNVVLRLPTGAEFETDVCHGCYHGFFVNARPVVTAKKPKVAAVAASVSTASVTVGADGRVECPDCNQSYGTAKSMMLHRTRAHPAVQCPDCSKGFATDRGLSMHRTVAHS